MTTTPKLDPKALEAAAQAICDARGHELNDQNRGGWTRQCAAAIAAYLSALPSAVTEVVVEEVAAAIRKALTENWHDDITYRKWDEDVLLTGCRKVGNGRGYENPERAAANLAKDAARAAISRMRGVEVTQGADAVRLTLDPLNQHPEKSVLDLALMMRSERDDLWAAAPSAPHGVEAQEVRDAAFREAAEVVRATNAVCLACGEPPNPECGHRGYVPECGLTRDPVDEVLALVGSAPSTTTAGEG